MRPILLDLFCGAGGAAMGYHRAGFDVVGVDINPQPHYPFEFHQADAFAYLETADLSRFAVIHASPPCQEYSVSRHLRNSNAAKKGYVVNIREKLVDDIRDALRQIGNPWVIENVVGSTLPEAIELCGSMFGLPIRRHRWFASSHLFFAPGKCRHTKGFYNIIGAKVHGYGDFRDTRRTYTDCRGYLRYAESHQSKAIGQRAFEIDWMTVAEMSEAIPPVYTEWIGKQLLQFVIGGES